MSDDMSAAIVPKSDQMNADDLIWQKVVSTIEKAKGA